MIGAVIVVGRRAPGDIWVWYVRLQGGPSCLYVSRPKKTSVLVLVLLHHFIQYVLWAIITVSIAAIHHIAILAAIAQFWLLCVRVAGCRI